MTKISVVICTYNPREDYLNRVLNALRQQTLPMENWELLLIDNASTTSLAGKYDLSWHPNARFLSENKLGKLNAWLLGVKMSTGAILIFVDDDNVLAPDYLEKALAISKEWPFVGAWGGSIEPEFETPIPAWCEPVAWLLTIDHVKEDVWSNFQNSFESIPSGAGMCVRREVAQHYCEKCRQAANLALDRYGEGHGGYGDTDQAFSAIEMGLGTGKSPRLRLIHLIPSKRLTLEYLVRRSEEDAVSLQMFRAIHGLPIKSTQKETWVYCLRWFFYRLIHHVPHEQYVVAKANKRGLERGWELAQNYLQKKSITN